MLHPSDRNLQETILNKERKKEQKRGKATAFPLIHEVVMNPLDILKIQKAWGDFSSRHVQFTQFINYICSHPIVEGDVISCAIEKTDNKGEISSNLKVTKEDLELIKIVQSMGKKAEKKP